MKTDRDLLGESAVYPGHPVTVALCIIRHFPSLAAATNRGPADVWGHAPPNALSDSTIPGAGGNVYLALDLIQVLAKGIDFDTALANADKDWANCDSQAKGGFTGEKDKDYYVKRWQEGQAQADRFKVALREEIGRWL